MTDYSTRCKTCGTIYRTSAGHSCSRKSVDSPSVPFPCLAAKHRGSGESTGTLATQKPLNQVTRCNQVADNLEGLVTDATGGGKVIIAPWTKPAGLDPETDVIHIRQAVRPEVKE